MGYAGSFGQPRRHFTLLPGLGSDGDDDETNKGSNFCVSQNVDASRVFTSWAPAQMEMTSGIKPMTRGQVHRRLTLRIAEASRDITLVNRVWLERHYLRRRPVPPRVKVLHIVGDVAGVDPGAAGCSLAVTVALLSGTASRVHRSLCAALGLHPCNVIELARSWRSDMLTPEVAPDLMPFAIRRIVKGGNGLKPLSDEWNTRRLNSGLSAPARVLLTYADPGVGHDGGLYLGAGAVAVGRTVNGKLAFAWALDGSLTEPLMAWAQAIKETR